MGRKATYASSNWGKLSQTRTSEVAINKAAQTEGMNRKETRLRGCRHGRISSLDSSVKNDPVTSFGTKMNFSKLSREQKKQNMTFPFSFINFKICAAAFRLQMCSGRVGTFK